MKLEKKSWHTLMINLTKVTGVECVYVELGTDALQVPSSHKKSVLHAKILKVLGARGWSSQR